VVFAGGGGLLLLMQPLTRDAASRDAARLKLADSFTSISYEVLGKIMHNVCRREHRKAS